jgi:hypothetical protein
VLLPDIVSAAAAVGSKRCYSEVASDFEGDGEYEGDCEYEGDGDYEGNWGGGDHEDGDY